MFGILNMNILFYSYFGFNPKNGGIERVSNALAKEFMKGGHKVFFVAKLPGPADISYTPIVEEIILPDPDEIYTSHSVEVFTEFVKKRNVDVIICQHSHDWDHLSPYIVKQNTEVKLLYAFHTTPCIYGLDIGDTTRPIFPFERDFAAEYRRITRALLKKHKQKVKNRKMGKHLEKIYEMGDGIVFLSPAYIPEVLRISNIGSSEKLFAIGDPNTYTNGEIVERPKENTLLFVGRLASEKSPEKVLLLWKRLQNRFPDWNLKIVGGGSLKEDLEKLKTKWRLERCFIEGRQDPAPYYSKAKILLVLSDYEGFCMAITEAMQHGTVPVVFNTFEAWKDIMEDGVTGLAVKPYDLKEFEDKVSLLMKDESRRIRMAEAAKISVRRFELPLIAAQWLDLFRKIGIDS